MKIFTVKPRSKSKKIPRVRLNKFQEKAYYFPVIFLILPVLGSVFYIFEDFTGYFEGVARKDTIFVIALILLVYSLGYVISLYYSLFFRKIEITSTEDQFKEAIFKTAEELGWQIEKNREGYVLASTSQLMAWGKMITIQKRKRYVLINTINSPEKYTPLFAFGTNRKHTRKFEANLRAVVNENICILP